jgi:hypothetical protein
MVVGRQSSRPEGDDARGLKAGCTQIFNNERIIDNTTSCVKK